MTPRGLLTPSGPANWKLGSSDHAMIQCAVHVGGKFIFELRRFITPIFLHMNVLHLAGNLSVQVSLGPRMLASYGADMYCFLFLVAGACGNLLSTALCIGGIGASTSTYGLAGAFLAQVWLIWESLEAAWREWLRNLLILAGVVALVFEAVMWNVVNHFAHLGGLLSGFALGVVLTRETPLPLIPSNVPALPANMAKRKQLLSIALALFVICCLCKICFLDPPPVIQVPVNGTQVEINGTRVFCDQQWAMYST